MESLPRFFSSLFDDIERSFLAMEQQKPFSKQELLRISNALEARSARNLQLPEDSKNVPELFTKIRDTTGELFINAYNTIKRRPLQDARARLEYTFKETRIPVSLFEDGIPILDDTSNRLNNIFTVQQVFYSDTPMAISAYMASRRVSTRTSTSRWDFLKQTI